MSQNNQRILYLSHGRGPLPLLGDAGHREMIEILKFIAGKIKRPSAILVISAHWEEEIPTITSAKNPSLIYDYYGFTKESYSIKYPCSGEPKLAEQLYNIINIADIKTEMNDQRGFDHGLFVPLKIMYPEADIPCIQLSLINSLNALEHLQLGYAINKIDFDDLLIIGSGFSFHNIREFFTKDDSKSKEKNEAFQKWLIETCTSSKFDETQRKNRFQNWELAPYARYSHPREEHLLPLHVCYGVAQKPCIEYFELNIMNKISCMFLW